MDKCIPEGFTKEEADFMDEVPQMLRENYSLGYVAFEYNRRFDTGLTTDEFHDRFDDYMKTLMNPPSEEDFEKYDPVEEFLAETKYSKAFRSILQEYEDWRIDQVEDEFQHYMKIYNENMEKFNRIMGSIKEIFG